MRLEYELAQMAVQAARIGWPVTAPGDPAPFPAGTYLGLRVGWIAWYEDGVEQIGPDWNLDPSGRLVSGEGEPVDTARLAAELVRIDACDGLPTADARHQAYDAQVELIARHVDNCLAHLSGGWPRGRRRRFPFVGRSPPRSFPGRARGASPGCVAATDRSGQPRRWRAASAATAGEGPVTLRWPILRPGRGSRLP